MKTMNGKDFNRCKVRTRKPSYCDDTSRKIVSRPYLNNEQLFYCKMLIYRGRSAIVSYSFKD